MMKCPDCEAILDDVPVGEPCPDCGGLRRDGLAAPRTIEATTSIPDVTVVVGYDLDRPWEQKWQDVTHLLQEIIANYGIRMGNDPVRRMVEGFFDSCRELADWLERDTGKAALAFVNTDTDLRLCDGFAQTTKHHTRTRKPDKKDPDPITARIRSISSGPVGVRVEIGWSSVSGKSGVVDALDLGRRCVTAWEKFLRQERLTP